MDIVDIATRDAVEVEASQRLAKVRGVFERDNPKGIIVTDEGEYDGIITERQLLQSHVEDGTKVGAMADSAPKIDRSSNVRDVARMLVEGGTKVAPVFENDDHWGMISADAILESVLDNLEVLSIEQIHTDSVVTITEDTNIGRAINLLRENGISRLPVLNENEKLTGMVTTHDIIEVAVRDVDKPTHGDRAGDRNRVLDIPVYDVMQNPVETVGIDSTVRDAVDVMLEHDYGGVVVTPTDEDDVVAGVLTKTDVLRALTFTEEEYLDVQITNIDLLDTLQREEIRRNIEEVVGKYQRMNVQHAHVRLQKHKEKLRGTPLIQCQIRLRTNHGQIAGSGEGYGADSAFRVALDRLERNVLELKGTRSDEQYEGQLLRKLNRL
ncbi:CBS domain-containing protein [Halocatena pleomorpha]|uniref:CBS domain-containing protein n=1 Tax=Halocatena pleomorpha TaxID=1785090 RepID=A0A3P3RMB7_9EURY|nr:CBS domain-containing protein [Halocatena pleomorpha]RRJ33543.1 CBS domain-containing protein [Halocatena pleomorpha]